MSLHPLLKRAPALLQIVQSLAHSEMETKSAASERTSCDDKAFEELEEVVTHAVARLKLD